MDTETTYKLYRGNSVDVLRTLPNECIDCCVTSPPYYFLRDYGYKEQIGLDSTPEEYISRLVEVFHEVKRVLKNDGTLWVNIGDTYNGNKKGNTEVVKNPSVADSQKFEKMLWKGAKTKDLLGIPWMLAFALRDDGWYLRQDIIWAKVDPMPESVKDRCTKSHEYIFLLSKSEKYYFDYEAIQEEAVGSDKPRIFGATKQEGTFRNDVGRVFQPNHKNLQYNGQRNNSMHVRRAKGLPDIVYTVRNKRDVWTVPVGGGYSDPDGVHYATYSEKLINPCILAGSRVGGVVLDPFSGTGTTGSASLKAGRRYIGIDMNEEYITMSEKRLQRIADQSNLFDAM